MGKAGRSILWFLAACLIFSQTAIATVAKVSTDVDGGWVLLFGFLCLGIVLLTLLSMFYTNPSFITAERDDLIPLVLIQQLTRDSNPEIFKHLIMNISSQILQNGEAEVPEESEETEEDTEAPEDIDTDENESEDASDYLQVLSALEPSEDGGAG